MHAKLEIFQQLSTVDLSMGWKVSSWKIVQEWNHRDLMVRSLEKWSTRFGATTAYSHILRWFPSQWPASFTMGLFQWAFSPLGWRVVADIEQRQWTCLISNDSEQEERVKMSGIKRKNGLAKGTTWHSLASPFKKNIF